MSRYFTLKEQNKGVWAQYDRCRGASIPCCGSGAGAGFVFFVDPDPHNLKKGKTGWTDGQKIFMLIQIFLVIIFVYFENKCFSENKLYHIRIQIQKILNHSLASICWQIY